MELRWRGCRLWTAGRRAVLENEALHTVWRLDEEGLTLQSLTDLRTGYAWQAADPAPALACMAPPAGARPRWEARVLEDSLEEASWLVQCVWEQGTARLCRSFRLFPDSPFLTLWASWSGLPAARFARAAADGGPTGQEQDAPAGAAGMVPGDIMACVPLPAGHLSWHSVRLVDQTDAHDTLTYCQSAPVYPAETLEVSGSFLQVEDRFAGQSLLAARHAPVTPAPGAQFRIAGGRLYVLQNGCAGALPEAAAGCACVLGTAPTAQLWRAYRAFYRRGWAAPWQRCALLSSNTWGDRSRDGRVCEAFVKREIDAAAALGLDAVQIDDGWQKGVTVNALRPQGGRWEGYYEADPAFWTPHPVRFPNGLVPLVHYAAQKGLRLGLWFAPDSSGEFANWQRDADTLLEMWSGWGIGIFKLDSVKLRTPLARKRYLALLDAVCRRSGNRIILQQDVTAEQRMGYLAQRRYGMLFVENRYTDFGNYYPHRTLRNLWCLARFLPAQRLQMELLNNGRNLARYADDPLAPALYAPDYLFAAAMAAQPLFWMELTGLSPDFVRRLRPILRAYKRHREALWQCDVRPVGSEPDGCSFTGFLFTAPGGRQGYLLAFRENTAEGRGLFAGAPAGARWELLCAGGPVRRSETAAGQRILFQKPRTYAFYRWQA